jgi:NAD(P)-dependent dehydrogenase (short-subunit alcohol dehydrogenase family)
MDELRLDGQVAVVTGAGRGLGRAHAALLAARGASVVVNNRVRPNEQDSGRVADEVAELISRSGGTAVPDTGDVGTRAGAESVVRTALDVFGRVDIVETTPRSSTSTSSRTTPMTSSTGCSRSSCVAPGA